MKRFHTILIVLLAQQGCRGSWSAPIPEGRYRTEESCVFSEEAPEGNPGCGELRGGDLEDIDHWVVSAGSYGGRAKVYSELTGCFFEANIVEGTLRAHDVACEFADNSPFKQSAGMSGGRQTLSFALSPRERSFEMVFINRYVTSRTGRSVQYCGSCQGVAEPAEK